MHKANWDDLRFVIAVARAGSLSRAAKLSGVNHATVMRRIAAFEERHGVRIFLRTKQGYRPAPGASRLLERMAEVEESILRLNRELSGAAQKLQGTVRLTSSDSLFAGPLPQILASFHQSEPGIRIETVSTNANLDLARLQADVTVRPAQDLPHGFTGDVAARLGLAVFGRRDTSDDQRWIGMGELLAKSTPGQWMAENTDPDQQAFRTDSFVVLRDLIAAGAGIGYMPVFLSYGHPELVELPRKAPRIEVDLWVASHTDLADVAPVSATRAYLTDELHARRDYLSGLS